MAKELKKASEVFVRLGGADAVITKEQHNNGYQPEDKEFYFIGYEDEEGEECEEDGTYFDQSI